MDRRHCRWYREQIAPLFKRPGSAPEVGDTELIAMAVVGERRGWDKQTELIKNCHEQTDLFPLIPERSRFECQSRNPTFAIDLIRKGMLQMMELAYDRQHVVESPGCRGGVTSHAPA